MADVAAPRWGKKFWADYLERVAATLVASVLGAVTLTSTTPIRWTDAAAVWAVLGVPTVVTALKGLLANLTDPSSGPSLLPAPPAPTVSPEHDDESGGEEGPRSLVRVLPRTDPRLGRHVEHDPRSRAFPAPSAAVIVSKTWRHYGPVLDQGQLGSCTGNAMAQALNTHPLRRTRTPYLTEADALALYEHATTLDDVPGTYPPDDTGSSGLAVAKAAQQAGYLSAYAHAFGLDHVLAALMNGPLIIGTSWTQDMFTPDARGFVHPTGAVAGGHEYLLLGVNVERGYLTFLNSWGTGWGDRGRFHMTLDDFAGLLADQGDAVQPVRA